MAEYKKIPETVEISTGEYALLISEREKVFAAARYLNAIKYSPDEAVLRAILDCPAEETGGAD